MSHQTATAADAGDQPSAVPAENPIKPRRRRRRLEPVPDWGSLARRMSYRERAELNRIHQELDTIARRLLVRCFGGAGDPAAQPAAERLAWISGEIAWMG